MIVALYILLALVGVGGLLYATRRWHSVPKEGIEAHVHAAEPEECCGQHATCERDSLLAAMSSDVEYFDDEDLDDFRGREPQSYTEAESERFRDVLLTLLPHDVAPWARSLQLRGIELPTDVRDELLMLVADNRQSNVTTV